MNAISQTSLAAQMAVLPPAKRALALAGLSADEVRRLEYDWPFWARPNQLPPPGRWRTWLLLAGRGFGKTRCGVEWVRSVKDTCGRIALIGPTAADARDVIVEGQSGIMATSPPWDRPEYEPSKRRLTWRNGAQAAVYSSEEPDRLRGPQHDAAYCDELAAWRDPATWAMLMFGLRLGKNPRCVVTTTPRPVKLIRDLIKAPTTVVTRGSTYDNRANLAAAFFTEIVGQYEGTRLGRQELLAEMLEDTPGALWSREVLDEPRVKVAPDMKRVVVAIDPAVTSGEKADETGIVVAGLGTDGRGYLLEDLSCKTSPQAWASRAIAAYKRHKADRIVAEVNNGGDLVEATIRMVDRNVPFTAVHATRGKIVRAEPIAALYEQKKISHVGGFSTLEDQMCAFTTDFDKRAAGYSPDRLDALVWAFTALMVKAPAPARVRKLGY